MVENIVIIGAGHAGGAAAISLRELGFSGSIRVIGDEAEPPYERPTLSKEFLSGADASPVYLANEDRWSELKVTLTLGVSAQAIDRDARRVTLSDGSQVSYDRLVLATGGRARRLDAPDYPRIHHLRTIEDARTLAAAARPGARAVIVGGGVIGLETASTLVGLGLSATVLEAGERLLGRNTPADAAAWIAEAHARIGVEIHLGRSLKTVTERPGGLTVGLDDGTTLDADLMVVGIGIIPCVELAEAAGLPTAAGVLVDADYRSLGDPDVFAIGDLALRVFGDAPAPRRMETWAHAQTSARAAALAILGQPGELEPTPWFWTAQCGHMLQIAGDPSVADSVVARGDGVRLYLRAGTLVGAACLDQPRDFGTARRLIGKALTPETAADPRADLRKAAA
ncbi:NAD(P)/FAD-dependent oxidoreductase [Brevundimonas sp. SL130]|uniref:NAD(P)/FAD-dependent oxidoreductase n=1 Tax=Brevundimonas sp. SL130 TaxID=2995143 RepID=UPI00226D36F4|nr:FAD-dependent oxidoreductase [Brevundimonas sp. SL130]WAC60766.1 FAD-dependent oxidoreductase [Brevundimonas sp. SL130]